MIGYILQNQGKNRPIYKMNLQRNRGDAMLKIAVCDDEPAYAKQISDRIKRFMPDCEIERFLSGEDLLLCGALFDIYFLDIQMEKMNLLGILKCEKDNTRLSTQYNLTFLYKFMQVW